MSKELREQYEKETTFSAIVYSEEDKAFILSSNYAEWIESKHDKLKSKLKEAEEEKHDLKSIIEFLENKLKEAQEQNKELRESIKIIEDMYLNQQAINKENEEKLK